LYSHELFFIGASPVLQVIFGLLEVSRRRYVDPSDFIKHLGLDAGQQQDAQEFSKLFLSVLEQNLAQGSSPGSTNVIKQQLCGTYAYVTRCSTCKTASERLSEFYELDLNIQGQKTLADALKGFLEVEKLDGDNQYMCSMCNSKQDATRAIELKTLPPVLNLQLLRFVFDLKTGSKKKLSSCIQFPDVLDMSEFLHKDCQAVYDLNAVLIHRGPSAYSGHYVAHIKSKDNQAWYKFNDEEVEKIKGRNLQLGSEDDLETKKQKMPKTPKGHHASKNAYMLVYTLRTNEQTPAGSITPEGFVKQTEPIPTASIMLESTVTEEAQSSDVPTYANENQNTNCSVPSTTNASVKENNVQIDQIASSEKSNDITSKTVVKEECTNNTKATKTVKDLTQAESSFSANQCLPAYVMRYVEKDNEKFEKWISEMKDMRDDSILKGQEKQETVKSIYKDLSFTESDGNNYEWLPMNWLSKWLQDPATTPPVDVSKLQCDHGKVCPEKCLKMKCVSQRGSSQLFDIYGGTLRLQGDESLCFKCVQSKCNLIRTKIRINEDDKFIATTMKKGLFSEEEKMYWIGKRSYRSWRRLAVEQLNIEEERQARAKLESTSDDEDMGLSGDSTDGRCGESGDGYNWRDGSDTADTEATASQRSVSEISLCANNEQSLTMSPTKSKSLPSTMMNGGGGSQDSEEECVRFNEDLLCEQHKGLDPDYAGRKLVPESVWTRLRRYFPHCPEFDAQQFPCEQCTASIIAENESKDKNRHLASVQKACLLDLYHDRKRPTVGMDGAPVFVVSANFVESWRRFVRDTNKYDPVTSIVNASLLCEHGGLLHGPEATDGLKLDVSAVNVSAEEWQIMKDMFEVDHEITVMCSSENDKSVVTIPNVCDECIQRRLSLEEGEWYDYDSGVLYIRKQTDAKTASKLPLPVENTDSNPDDPEFRDKSGSGKKRNSVSDGSEPAEKCSKGNGGSRIVRKSQRHRRVRGEKEVTISSKSTLKELKLEIMKLFSVPPFDQNLYLDGRVLEDNTKTLCELRVASGSVIDLIADEPNEEMAFLDDFSKDSVGPESGFKGTNLLSA